MKLTEKIYDITTGIETVVERELTKEELADKKSLADLISKLEAETQATAIAKSAILDRLGLTDDEAKLLLS